MRRGGDVQFEREALYEEVWRFPITKLAAKYNLSDNGLRKVCAALSVPVPPRGYWAKLAAGRTARKIPLPGTSERKTFVSRTTPERPQNPFATAEDAQWLQERLAFERNESNAIEVEDPPRRWHAEVRDIRDAYDAAAKEAQIWKRDFERAEARQQRSKRILETTYDERRWAYFKDQGSILCPTHKTAPLRVGPDTNRRALAIVNAIFLAALKRDVRPSLDAKEGRFRLEADGGAIHFAVRERLDELWRSEINSWTKKPEQKKYKQASGKLFIAVYKNGYDSKLIADAPTTKLSEAIFGPLYGKVVEQREKAREETERERRRQAVLAQMEIEKAQRQGEKRAAKERERIAAAERAREIELLAEAVDWQNAALIRRYAEHMRTLSTDPSVETWASWASSVAEKLDPLRRRLGGSSG